MESTIKRAIKLAEIAGGSTRGSDLVIAVQTPRPAKLELWNNYGSPVERLPLSDPRWQWKGDWQSIRGVRFTSSAGSEALIQFDGTGANITGLYLPDSGTAAVYLDGRLHKNVDVYSDKSATKNGESVWHVFGLKPGHHQVRLAVAGQSYGASKGAQIGVQDLVVFR